MVHSNVSPGICGRGFFSPQKTRGNWSKENIKGLNVDSSSEQVKSLEGNIIREYF